ncbi:hypothetical protein BaRGS_00004014 [Batillaria attramentaria]|uniref:Uncharacterized protein n=1 Tax=Batillaria attramentaria TaxID=370345 RepID=A0ABD0LZX6_9CAEN
MSDAALLLPGAKYTVEFPPCALSMGPSGSRNAPLRLISLQRQQALDTNAVVEDEVIFLLIQTFPLGRRCHLCNDLHLDRIGHLAKTKQNNKNELLFFQGDKYAVYYNNSTGKTSA